MQISNFGQKLKELRENAKLTQKQLADKLFISDKVISKWETGTSYPSIDNVVNVANFFNVDIDYLIDNYELAKRITRKTEKNGIRKRRLPYSYVNGVLDIMAFGLILFMFVEILVKYDSIPQIIATHFNGAGVADGYGDKSLLFLSPCLALAFASIMTILNFVRIRWYINLGLSVPIESFAVNEEHAIYIFKVASIALSVMKLFLVLWIFDSHLLMSMQIYTRFILFGVVLTLFCVTPVVAIMICNRKGKLIKAKMNSEKNCEKSIYDDNALENNAEKVDIENE